MAATVNYHKVGGLRDSLVAQMVKNPPAIRETWVQSLGWEEPLEDGMATHSSFLAWNIPMDRGAWRTTVHEVSKIQTRLSDSAQRSTALEQHSLFLFICFT